ncbi:hypothetical protein P8452_12991 [Trifolium repens]|nr:hypothetical protein P8452_12991 [Trifolium repens]
MSTFEALKWEANFDQNMLIRRCKVKSRQKLHIRSYTIRSRVLKTSCSDTCSESRFFRRTFSATMIGFHHLLTTQNLENQPYPQNNDVSTIVRTYYLIWTNLYSQDCSYTKVT